MSTKVTDTDKIKIALEAKLHELEQRAESIETNLSEEANPDWEENAKESQDDEVLTAIANFTEDDIRDIKRALSRIESGGYGKCESCDKPIATERLKVLPYTTQCINCA